MARPDTNYLTAPELTQVGKLIAHLNDVKPPLAPLSAEIVLTDLNGDCAGYVGFNESGAYVYYPTHAAGS